MKATHFLTAAAAALLALTGCGLQSQRVTFYLQDAPLDGASQVNVTLTGMKVFASAVSLPDGGSDPGGKSSVVFDAPKTLDLLQLKSSGMRDLLGTVTVTGRIDTIMLQGDGVAQVVYADGTTKNATIPSGAASGIKIQGPIDPGATGEVVLDYDAAQSIHDDGAGGLIMRPVIHVLVDGQHVTDSDPVN